MDFHKKLRERGLVRPFTGLEDVSDGYNIHVTKYILVTEI